MKVFSYVVARDFGFAPNPFHGVCTLATCKPKIRARAEIGDYVVGTGSARFSRAGRLVYWMRISATHTFDEYWCGPQFERKKPNLHGSLKQAYGDNIYRQGPSGRWLQAPSHHSLPNGSPNPKNVKHDTQASRVLIGSDFAYWGGSGPRVPARFQCFCAGRGYKSRFPEALVRNFVAWLQANEDRGCVGIPFEWSRRV